LKGSGPGTSSSINKSTWTCDHHEGASPLVIDDFKKDKNIEVIVSPGIGLIWLTFNLHKETPIRDVTARKAIMHRIDRNRIVKIVYLGYAQTADNFNG